jgi:hypothetical protein
MAIRVLNRFPGANVRVLAQPQAPDAELVFAPDPHGGPEALWFDFRIEDSDPPAPVPESMALTLRFFDVHPGKMNPDYCRPVIRETGKSWNRLRAPSVTTLDDGQPLLHWTIPYPAARVELALCHPYGREELDVMLQRAKGYWREESIGLTQGGRLLTRLDNRVGGKGKGTAAPRGLYLLARQQPGETPGSWVLDGMLETISRARSANWCVWSTPFADLDGMIAGNHAGDFTAGRAWMEPPMRYEGAVLQGDMSRWAERCRPELVVDLQAAGIRDNDGIHVSVAPAAPDAERNRQAWTNIMQQALGPEFAADPFTRMTGTPPGTDAAGGLADYVHKACGCCALTIRTPYTACRETLMTPKQYREAGRRLAQAILTRW